MTEERTKFCPRCGTMIPYHEEFCPLCGERQPQMPGMPRGAERKTWIAVVLSLLVTGLGHMYLREWRRGLCFFGVVFVVGLLVSDSTSYEQVILIGAIIGVAAAIDVYYLGKRKQG